MFEGQVLRFLVISFSFIVVLVCIYYLVNKFNLYLPRSIRGKHVKLLEVVPVGKNFWIVLLEVEKVRLLVAFSESSVKLIKEFKVEDGGGDG